MPVSAKEYRNGLLKRLRLYGFYMIRRSSYLKDTGWYRSTNEGTCVDRAGKPVPWFTYPAATFLSRRVMSGMSVFEYGAGASTLWWAARVKEVIACEHDRSWYEKIRANLLDNVTLVHRELEYGGAYAKTITAYPNRFDIVVIDGRDRVNCARHAVGALKDDGVIVWDNSDRDSYQEGYDFLKSHGFRQIEFVGLAPMIGVTSETSIFYRQRNCLGI